MKKSRKSNKGGQVPRRLSATPFKVTPIADDVDDEVTFKTSEKKVRKEVKKKVKKNSKKGDKQSSKRPAVKVALDSLIVDDRHELEEKEEHEGEYFEDDSGDEVVEGEAYQNFMEALSTIDGKKK